MEVEAQVLKAFNTWKTIYVSSRGYFILPTGEEGQQIRDAIENEYLNPGSEDCAFVLEKATEKGGTGTGEFQSVSVAYLVLALRGAEETIRVLNALR